MKNTILFAALAVMACGPGSASVGEETDVSQGAALGGEVLVSFNRNWTITRGGDLSVGSTVRVSYDSMRLPQCRLEQAGQPLWAITGHWRLGADTGSFEAGGASPTNHTTGPLIPLTRAGELEVWFDVKDPSGCSAWDSAYGQNYRFTVLEVGPTLRFLPNWVFQQTADTRGAKALAVEYDPARLPNCRQGYNGMPTWAILMYYRFDGGAPAYLVTTRPSGATQVMNPVVLGVPAGARRVELWFKSNDRAGCVEWDSRFSQNYAFDL